MSAKLGIPLMFSNDRNSSRQWNQSRSWDMGLRVQGGFIGYSYPEKTNYDSGVRDTEQDKLARSLAHRVREDYPQAIGVALEIEYVNCAHAQSISWQNPDGTRKAFAVDPNLTFEQNQERLQQSLSEAGIGPVSTSKYRF